MTKRRAAEVIIGLWAAVLGACVVAGLVVLPIVELGWVGVAVPGTIIFLVSVVWAFEEIES